MAAAIPVRELENDLPLSLRNCSAFSLVARGFTLDFPSPAIARRKIFAERN
jgi:hypothetical protein